MQKRAELEPLAFAAPHLEAYPPAACHFVTKQALLHQLLLDAEGISALTGAAFRQGFQGLTFEVDDNSLSVLLVTGSEPSCGGRTRGSTDRLIASRGHSTNRAE